MTAEQIAAAREQPRAKEMLAWRKSVSMDQYKAVAKKFKDAGIDIKLLCYNMNEAVTDDEIEYAFTMAKALGADAISSSTQVTVSKRIAPFAEKHKMMFGYHGHDSTWDPNEFSTPGELRDRDVLFQIQRREPGYRPLRRRELRPRGVTSRNTTAASPTCT